MLTQHTPAGRRFPVLRPYTPIQGSDTRGYVQLLVKHYPGGVASTYMHSLQPGQTLTVRGPIPGNCWTSEPSSSAAAAAAAAPRDVLFLAGGAGITPIYSLTKRILGDPTEKTRIKLVWGVNTPEDLVLRDELEGLEREFPGRLSVTYCISDPKTSRIADDEKFRKGRVDRSVLQDAIRGFGSGWAEEKGRKVFVCGPPAMEEAVAGRKGVLKELNVGVRDIYRF